MPEEQLPTDIVLIKDFPPFTKGTQFHLNSQMGDRYEIHLMMPFYEGNGKLSSEIKIYLSFSAVGFEFIKDNFLTLEEYENKKFNDYRISELENLIEKIKQL